MSFNIGVDVGGTFTDIILADENTGDIEILKIPTTPRDPANGFLHGISRILREKPEARGRVRSLVHGTTVATNAVLERKGPKTALITTKGCRDLLEIGRQRRPSLYDFQIQKSKPLVPRYLRYEARERVNFKGKVLTAIDKEDLLKLVNDMKSKEVQSVAICYLFSFLNQNNEKETKKLIHEAYPDAWVTISSEIVPEFREFERLSTTVLNAYLSPLIDRYLSKIVTELGDYQIDPNRLYVMQSMGGIVERRLIGARSHTIIESGPAAGVVAANFFGRLIGLKNVITFDMGGTTAKASLIHNNAYDITTQYEIYEGVHQSLAVRGAGYPIRTPAIDLAECSAGGGSIAWVDSGGALKVGPQSAGAYPGPACYGIGGTEPTVTDANVVLGRINPNQLLGGELRLRADLSRRAIEKSIKDKIGLSLARSAWGIVEVANSMMTRIMRTVSISKGYDPREFDLIAFGGAGPLHASEIAKDLGVKHVIIPTLPGLFSAMGLLVSDLRNEFGITKVMEARNSKQASVNSIFRKLNAMGNDWLEKQGVPKSQRVLTKSIDVRYMHQNYELNVPIRTSRDTGIEEVRKNFHRLHKMKYGYSAEEDRVQFVTFRLAAIGKRPKLQIRYKENTSHTTGTKIERRPVYFKEFSGYVKCPVYDRTTLTPGSILRGPAVIEQFDSTTVVLPRQRLSVDNYGNLIIQIRE